MAFTQITITSNDFAPNAKAAQGTLTATLSEPMVNGTEVIDPTPISGMFVAGAIKDASGIQPFTLAGNTDTGTNPASPPTHYQFVIELDSAPVRVFSAIVPSNAAGATIDLSVLEATAA